MADGLACCVPLAREPISVEQANGVVPMLKAIADPARLRLLSLVLSHEGGEACVCDLTTPFDMTQPAIGHHLKILIDAGILKREKPSSWAWYSIVAERLQAVQDLLPGPRFLKTSRDQ